jgi:hypothetical protein
MGFLRIAAVLLSVFAIVAIARGQGADKPNLLPPMFTDTPDLGPIRVFMGTAHNGTPAIQGRAYESPNDDNLRLKAVLAVNGTNLRITADEIVLDRASEALILSGSVRITLNPGYRQNQEPQGERLPSK